MPKFNVDEWETRGWQGIRLEVPEEWDIAAISGDRNQGYMRLDDRENMPRVEVKWQQASGFVDIKGVVDQYLKDLNKKRGKNQPQVEVDRDCAVVSKRRMRKQDLNCFAWRGEIEGYGAAWYCTDCERVMVIQVMARDDEDGIALAREVIGNMSDHPEDGWITWATYGLHMEVPERFELVEQKLMAGLIELQFACRGEEVKGARMGMANVALRDRTLEEWVRAEVSKYHKGVKLSYEETIFRGHPAVAVTGYFSNPLRHLQSFVMHVMGKPYPEAVSGWAWHSEDENRIYYAGAMLDEDNIEVAEEIAMRMRCPEGEAGETEGEEEPIR